MLADRNAQVYTPRLSRRGEFFGRWTSPLPWLSRSHEGREGTRSRFGTITSRALVFFVVWRALATPAFHITPHGPVPCFCYYRLAPSRLGGPSAFPRDPGYGRRRCRQIVRPRCLSAVCTVLNPETAFASLRDIETPMTGA